jgi:hypothetical protein
MRYQVELVWNREFDFVPFGAGHDSVESAARKAEEVQNMGDGASVKKTRVVDEDGKVVWAYGKITQ